MPRNGWGLTEGAQIAYIHISTMEQLKRFQGPEVSPVARRGRRRVVRSGGLVVLPAAETIGGGGNRISLPDAGR